MLSLREGIWPSWIKYAWIEFSHSFRRPYSGKPGDRSFLSLTAVMVLLISFLAVSLSIHRGLIINFADSLLGYTKGAGVPIRVEVSTDMFVDGRAPRALGLFRNFDEIGGIRKASDLQAQNSTLNSIEFLPYIEIETGYVAKLTQSAWKKKSVSAAEQKTQHQQKTAGKLQFRGWAISSESSLWKSFDVPPENSLTTIVFSQSRMDKHFDRNAYERELFDQITEQQFKAWKLKNPHREKDGRLNTIYLELPYQDGVNYWVEFNIHWVPSIPAVERITYVMPFSLFKQIEYSLNNSAYKFVPYLQGGATLKLVSSIVLFEAEETLSGKVDAFRDKVSSCLRLDEITDISPDDPDLIIKTRSPVNRTIVENCLKKYGFIKALGKNLSINEVEIVAPVVAGREVILTCSKYSRQERASKILEGCQTGRKTITLPLIEQIYSGLAYAPERTKLVDVVGAIAGAKVGPFDALFISESYRNSIDRFQYLTNTLEYISMPAAIFFLAIALYFLTVSIGQFFSRRKRNYGVLLARGMSIFEIRKVIAFQFSISILISSIFSFFILVVTKAMLNFSFAKSDAYLLARNELGIFNPILTDSLVNGSAETNIQSIGLSLHDIVQATIVVGGMTIALIIMQVIIVPLRSSTFPIRLISQSE